MSLVTEEATPAHWTSLAALMAEASRGCFCRWWHFGGDDNAWQARCNLQPGENRSELEAALTTASDEARGVVALDGSKVVGWLKLCPASGMSKLLTRRPYKRMACFGGDRSGVLVVGCMLVHPDARRNGVAGALVKGAVQVARLHGARAVEATPRRSVEPLRDEELWTGPPSVLSGAGFVVVAGPDAYPVMRLEFEP